MKRYSGPSFYWSIGNHPSPLAEIDASDENIEYFRDLRAVTANVILKHGV